MTVVSVIACIIVFWGLVTRKRSYLVDGLRAIAPSPALARLAVLSLVPLYACDLALVVIQSRLEIPTSPFAWMKTLPIPVFDHSDEVAPYHEVIARIALALGLMESALIGTIVLALLHKPAALGKYFIVASACALAALSLLAPAMTTLDPYEYVATGMLGFHAYAPAADAFVGTLYEPYVKHRPLTGVIYGPLWVLIDTVQTNFGASVYEKIEAIRISNVALIGLYLSLLRRAGASRAVLMGFALNPSVWLYFVANPHADIEGLLLLAAAYDAARRSRMWLTMLFLVAAGLVKFPFVIIGCAVLVPLAGKTRRLLSWALALALVLVVSYLVPGPQYMRDVAVFATHRAATSWHPEWLVVVALIAVASGLLVWLRRDLFGAAWLFQQLPGLAAPWYLFWGLPYASATGTAEMFLIALPLTASVLDQAARSNIACQFILFAAVLFVGTDLYLTKRHSRLTVTAGR